MNESYLNSIWEKAKQGLTVEGTNLDLKRKWWDFQTELDEFLKDVCLMANNHSGESYIILGMDENGTTHNASLPEDEANIQSRHKSKIEPPINLTIEEFSLDGKTISVISIPHSSNRPHTIKKYRGVDNWVPVRFGTSTRTASRSDLDEMYEERYSSAKPNLKVEFAEQEITWANYATYLGPCFRVSLILDNSNGFAPEYITSVTLKELDGENWEGKYYKFEGARKVNEEYKIESFDRKKGVLFYVSDLEPTGNLATSRKIPDFDRDQLELIIKTNSGIEQHLKVMAGWIKVG